MSNVCLPRELVERLLDTNRNAVHMEDFKSLQSALSVSVSDSVSQSVTDCHQQERQLKLLTEDLRLAIESMIESHEAGDLDGWEVQLVKRRLHKAAHGIGVTNE